MHIRGRLKGERAGENERRRVPGDMERIPRQKEKGGVRKRACEEKIKRDDENKRAAERGPGTLFVVLLKIHKALCLLTKDTRFAPVASQSLDPNGGHPRALATPRERRALSRKIKLLVALFSTRAARKRASSHRSFSSSPTPRESRGANFSRDV